MTERVLVVGNGFIGSHVVRSLSVQGDDTVVLTRSRSPDSEGRVSDAQVIVADASDYRAVNGALRGVRHVIYCAGGLFPAQSNREPFRDIQLTLSPLLTILEALRQHPEIGLTFISSGGTIYGRTEKHLVDESHPTNPVTSYGVSKLASEKYISMYYQLYGIQSNVLRCSNVYGEGQPPDRGQGVVAAFLDRLLSNEPLTIFGDGTVRRDFLHVSDVAAVITQLMDRLDGCRILNLGSGEGTTILELLTVLELATGRKPVVQSMPGRAFDVPGIVLDISRLRQLVDFRPIGLAHGVRETWEHMPNNGQARAVAWRAPKHKGLG